MKCQQETHEVNAIRWSKHTNYKDEVNVEVLGPTLCLPCEFLSAILPFSFCITTLFRQYCHQA